MTKKNIIILVSVLSAVLVIAGIIIAVFCFENSKSSTSEADKNTSVSATESVSETISSSESSPSGKDSSSSINSKVSENQSSEKSDTDAPQREEGELEIIGDNEKGAESGNGKSSENNSNKKSESSLSESSKQEGGSSASSNKESSSSSSSESVIELPIVTVWGKYNFGILYSSNSALELI